MGYKSSSNNGIYPKLLHPIRPSPRSLLITMLPLTYMPRPNRITDTVTLVPSSFDILSSPIIAHGASQVDPPGPPSRPGLSQPQSLSAFIAWSTHPILRRDHQPMLAPATPSLVGNGCPDPTATMCLQEDANFKATTSSPAVTRTRGDPVAQVPDREA